MPIYLSISIRSDFLRSSASFSFLFKRYFVVGFFKFSGKEFQSLIPSKVRELILKLVDIACRESPRRELYLVV